MRPVHWCRRLWQTGRGAALQCLTQFVLIVRLQLLQPQSAAAAGLTRWEGHGKDALATSVDDRLASRPSQ